MLPDTKIKVFNSKYLLQGTKYRSCMIIHISWYCQGSMVLPPLIEKLHFFVNHSIKSINRPTLGGGCVSQMEYFKSYCRSRFQAYSYGQKNGVVTDSQESPCKYGVRNPRCFQFNTNRSLFEYGQVYCLKTNSMIFEMRTSRGQVLAYTENPHLKVHLPWM